MVYIFLGKGFEEIEAVAPCDILRRGGVQVAYVAVEGREVEGAHGVRVTADVGLDGVDLDKAEMLVVPGGLGGVESIEASAGALSLLRQAGERDLPLAAICAGPRVLGRLGLSKGRHIVCYPGMEEQMGGALVDNTKMTARDGKLLTGRGPGAAVPFGLELLRFLRGNEAATTVAAGMTCDDFC